jgi:hypothetical protein
MRITHLTTAKSVIQQTLTTSQETAHATVAVAVAVLLLQSLFRPNAKFTDVMIITHLTFANTVV